MNDELHRVVARRWRFGGVLTLVMMAAYFGLLGTLVALSRGFSILVRIGLIAVFAVAVEWLRGDAWYLRFPWYTPAHALAEFPPMLAGARWLGAWREYQQATAPRLAA